MKKVLSSDFGDCWLGNIVERSGIAKWDETKKQFEPCFECRGSLYDLNLNDNGEIYFATETAWRPFHDMWIGICDKYLPSGYEILFISEECGMGYYATNNPEFIGKYNVENCFDYDEDFSDDEVNLLDNIECRMMTENEVKKLLKSLLKSDSNNINKLIRELHDSKFDNTLYINKWEICNLN